MSHILKGLGKRNMHIPLIVLFDEEKWQKMCSNAYFGGFTGGGHFWRVTPLPFQCTNPGIKRVLPISNMTSYMLYPLSSIFHFNMMKKEHISSTFHKNPVKTTFRDG